MTTTELIEILRKNEFGGATGRAREVMFCIGDKIINTDGIEVTGSGDGLTTELYLSLPDAEPKKGRWEMEPDPYGFFEEIPVCSECGCTTEMRKTYNFCPNCGADMRRAECE